MTLFVHDARPRALKERDTTACKTIHVHTRSTPVVDLHSHDRFPRFAEESQEREEGVGYAEEALHRRAAVQLKG